MKFGSTYLPTHVLPPHFNVCYVCWHFLVLLFLFSPCSPLPSLARPVSEELVYTSFTLQGCGLLVVCNNILVYIFFKLTRVHELCFCNMPAAHSLWRWCMSGQHCLMARGERKCHREVAPSPIEHNYLWELCTSSLIQYPWHTWL